MAIWITLSGLVVTAIVIILFMPKYSYWAAAYGHLASYIVMFVISSILGAKYYPIPYRWWRLVGIFLLMGGIYALSLVVDNMFFRGVTDWSSTGLMFCKLGVHTLMVAAYVLGVWKLIKK